MAAVLSTQLIESLSPAHNDMIPEDKRDELNNIRLVLEKLNQEYNGHAVVQEQVARALRAVEQFNSGIEVIVCMGMLKAGKSTLVNLLARSPMASPTGYGQDVTLRPALIRMAEPGAEPRIVLYERAEDAAEPAANLLAPVLDHLRGITGEEGLTGISVRTLPLNEANLRGVLCHSISDSPHLTAEPVLVVVEPEHNPDCQLLCSRNRMILDMPGCDSAVAEVAQGERYREIGRECDMLLLLQSSVAPLNSRAVEEMTALLDGRTPSTIRIIQNRMESKSWLRGDVFTAENDEQTARALAVLRRLAENRELPVSAVNLGMAYAGIFEDKQRLRKKVELADGVYHNSAELLAGSGFAEMETGLHKELTHIRYTHCCDALRQALRSLSAAAIRINRSESKKLDVLRKRLERWDAFRTEARAALRTPTVPAKAEFSVAPGQMPDFVITCENIYRERRELYKGPKATGRDINQCMADCNDACREILQRFVSTELTDKHIQMTHDGEKCTVANWCNRNIRDMLKDCCERLQTLDAELWGEFADAEHPDFLDWQEQHNMPLSPEAAEQYTVFEPFVYEERVHRWWWKDADKLYDIFWGNELFVNQVVNPMVEHYCAEAHALMNKQSPAQQMQSIVTTEVRNITTGFFDALTRKRKQTRSDIGAAEKAQNRAQELMEAASDMLTTCEEKLALVG